MRSLWALTTFICPQKWAPKPNVTGQGVVAVSSVVATSGLSGEEGDRRDTIRRQETRRAETTESRRGYVVGAAWDEGNMIQAMARLKNPTIAWRYGYGDG